MIFRGGGGGGGGVRPLPLLNPRMPLAIYLSVTSLSAITVSLNLLTMSESSQSLHCILSLRINSSFITSRPGAYKIFRPSRTDASSRLCLPHGRIQTGDRVPDTPPPENHKNIGLLSYPDTLKIHKATKPAFNVGSSWIRQGNAV